MSNYFIDNQSTNAETASLNMVRLGNHDHNNIIKYMISEPRFTLFKKNFNRYSDIELYKKYYSLEKNACTISGIDKFSLAEKIWVSDVKNIKRLKIFLIPNEFDTSILTTDTNIKAHNNAFNILHKYERHSSKLYTYKKEIDVLCDIDMRIHRIIRNESDQNYNLILLDRCMYYKPDFQYKFHIVIDTYENKNHYLLIDHMISHYRPEILSDMLESYVIRSFVFNHTLNTNNNSIKSDIYNNTISIIFFLLDKDSCDKIIINSEYPSRTHEVRKIHDDLEFNYQYENNKYDLFIFRCCQFNDNIPDNYGYIHFMRDTLFTFQMLKESEITINYFINDVINYKNNQVYFNCEPYSSIEGHETNQILDDNTPFLRDLINEEQERQVMTSEEYISINTINNEHYIESTNVENTESLDIESLIDLDQIHQERIVDLEINMLEQDNNHGSNLEIPDHNRDIRLYHAGIYRTLKLIDHLLSQSVLLDEETQCCVSLDEIEYDSFYYRCTQCDQVISESSFRRWTENINQLHKTCPLCRYEYVERPQLYKNNTPIIVLCINKLNNILCWPKYYIGKWLIDLFPHNFSIFDRYINYNLKKRLYDE